MQFITVSSILLSALSYLISPTTASGITLEYPTSLVNREFNPKYTGKLRVRALTPTYEPLPGTEFDQITAIYQYNNFYVGNIQQHPSAEPLIIEITMKNLSPEMGHGFNFKSRSARGGTSYQDLYAIKEGNNRLGMTMPHSVRKPQGATTYGWTIDEQGLIRFDGKPHFAACPIKADEMTIAGQAVQMPTYAIEFIGVGGGIYPGCALIFLWALKV